MSRISIWRYTGERDSDKERSSTLADASESYGRVDSREGADKGAVGDEFDGKGRRKWRLPATRRDEWSNGR